MTVRRTMDNAEFRKAQRARSSEIHMNGFLTGNLRGGVCFGIGIGIDIDMQGRFFTGTAPRQFRPLVDRQ